MHQQSAVLQRACSSGAAPLVLALRGAAPSGDLGHPSAPIGRRRCSTATATTTTVSLISRIGRLPLRRWGRVALLLLLALALPRRHRVRKG